ncbi:p38 MAP kinase [Penicillium verhagenii]|nr:p38 MAP kinase [Penicillium verhagenii]
MSEFTVTNLIGTVFETTNSSARDIFTSQTVAIKKIPRPFSRPELAKRTYREVKLLKQLHHENTVRLNDVFLSPREDIYIVTEFLVTDLQTLLSVRPLEARFTKYFMYQIMRGLKYIHSADIIHRDLKPGSLLVNENCDLKICDFGLARIHDHQMTGYVTTRYYRAPEVMLSWQKYGNQVDIWSAGCIMGEMLQGKPLFPGVDHVDQFRAIINSRGTPPDDVVNQIPSENTQEFVRSLPKCERRDLSYLPNITPEGKFLPDSSKWGSLLGKPALDLLEKTLNFDPRERIGADESLVHPYMAEYHDPTDEPTAKEPFDWTFSDRNCSLETWKMMVHWEIVDFQFVEQSTEESIFSTS